MPFILIFFGTWYLFDQGKITIITAGSIMIPIMFIYWIIGRIAQRPGKGPDKL
jgi:hypothetical protein